MCQLLLYRTLWQVAKNKAQMNIKTETYHLIGLDHDMHVDTLLKVKKKYTGSAQTIQVDNAKKPELLVFFTNIFMFIDSFFFLI